MKNLLLTKFTNINIQRKNLNNYNNNFKMKMMKTILQIQKAAILHLNRSKTLEFTIYIIKILSRLKKKLKQASQTTKLKVKRH